MCAVGFERSSEWSVVGDDPIQPVRFCDARESSRERHAPCWLARAKHDEASLWQKCDRAERITHALVVGQERETGKGRPSRPFEPRRRSCYL
jgi:hypothetical protein